MGHGGTWRAGPGGTLCLSGCANLGYYWQSATGHLKIMQAARPVQELAGRPGDARRACASGWSCRSASATTPARAEAARQPELPPLRRPAPHRRDLERDGRAGLLAGRSRPGASRSRAASATAATTTRPRRAEAASCAQQGLRGQRLPGHRVFDAGLDELGRRRPAAQHLHRLSRRRAGAPDLPRAGAPGGLRQERHDVQRVVRHAVERLGGTRWLETQADEKARQDYAAYDGRRRLFRELSRVTRERLKAVYETPGMSPGEGRGGKQKVMEQFRTEYAQMKGLPGMDPRLARLRPLGARGEQRLLRRAGGVRRTGARASRRCSMRRATTGSASTR
jgi:hypothetical protein